MLPEQVSRYWEFFGSRMALSFPPTMTTSINIMTNVLKSIMLGRLTVWCYAEGGDLKAIISTHVWREEVSDTVDLLIYSFTALEALNYSDWEFIRDRLGEHARSNGCKMVTAFTDNPKVAKFLESQGGDVTNLIRMEV